MFGEAGKVGQRVLGGSLSDGERKARGTQLPSVRNEVREAEGVSKSMEIDYILDLFEQGRFERA